MHGRFEEGGLAIGADAVGEGQELFEDGADGGDAEQPLDVGGQGGVPAEGVGEEALPRFGLADEVGGDGGGPGVEAFGVGRRDLAGA